MITGSHRSVSSPLSGVVASATDVAGDFVELVELQVRLTELDSRQFFRRIVPILVSIVGCSVLLLASMPTLVAGLAQAISTTQAIPLWACQLTVGGSLAIVSAMTMAIMSRRLKSTISSFQSSQEQLQQNLRWLKSIIRGQ